MKRLLSVSSDGSPFRTSHVEKNSMTTPSWQQKAQSREIKIHLTVPQGIHRLKDRSRSNSPDTSGNITPDSAHSFDGSENFSSDTDHSFLLKSTEKLKHKEKCKKSQQNRNLQGNRLDRFIPNRATTNIGISHYKITLNGNDITGEEEQTNYEKVVETALLSGKSLREYPVLSFSNQSKDKGILKCRESNCLENISNCKGIRSIPTCPEKVLDAPNLLDGHCLQLMDWSKEGNLAVAMCNSVYVWNYDTEESQMIFSLEDGSYYVSSVSWIEQGPTLAVGINCGEVQLWDTVEQKLLRTMRGHTDRVASLSWKTFILSRQLHGVRGSNLF